MSGLENAVAFLYQNGTLSAILGMNALSEADGVNDRREVVGVARYRGFY